MPRSDDSEPTVGRSKPRPSKVASSSLFSPIPVDVYLYHEGMVRLWSGVKMTLIAENICFPIDLARTGWLRVECVVAGCLGASNAVHCLVAGGTTLQDVLTVFGEPATSWVERA